MKEYRIVRKTDWDQVPELEMNEKGLPFDAPIRAFCKVCYDDEALYVRLRAEETAIRATYTDGFGMPCEDSCLEFFFSPDPSSEKYFNIEMNPNCAMFLGIGTCGAELIRLNPMAERFGFQPSAERTETGWTLTYRVPYCFIRFFFPGFAPKTGDTMKANAYKCGDLCDCEHYLSWNPVDFTVENGAFHNPKCFGLMHFV